MHIVENVGVLMIQLKIFFTSWRTLGMEKHVQRWYSQDQGPTNIGLSVLDTFLGNYSDC